MCYVLAAVSRSCCGPLTISVCVCVCVFSGLLGGGHERVVVDLPTALTGVWTRLPEKGKWMDFQEWEKWEDLFSSVSERATCTLV